jgi:hypothetical protein
LGDSGRINAPATILKIVRKIPVISIEKALFGVKVVTKKVAKIREVLLMH